MAQLTVVIWDDVDRTWLIHALRLAGHTVLKEWDIGEAIAKAEYVSADGAIIDFGYSRTSIDHLIRRLRKCPTTRIFAAPSCRNASCLALSVDYPILAPDGLVDLLQMVDELFANDCEHVRPARGGRGRMSARGSGVMGNR